jgi:hypothetical protein
LSSQRLFDHRAQRRFIYPTINNYTHSLSRSVGILELHRDLSLSALHWRYWLTLADNPNAFR